MPKSDPENAPSITPCLSYRDAPAAIEWLCRAFGFEKQLVVPGERAGEVRHAQLKLGRGMIMVSTSADDDTARLWQKSPRQLGGTTVGINVYVADPDAHMARAVAAGGVEIISPCEDKPHGGRGYNCRDAEGYLWYFGSYDPWAG
jgi:uncharacterized glyoxalase superfamily protein PhnB